jgi:hypothetical protein
MPLDTDKDCDLLHDRWVLSTGRTPHNKQNWKYLDFNQNMVMSPGGARRQAWLTDWPTVSCKVTLTLKLTMPIYEISLNNGLIFRNVAYTIYEAPAKFYM